MPTSDPGDPRFGGEQPLHDFSRGRPLSGQAGAAEQYSNIQNERADPKFEFQI